MTYFLFILGFFFLIKGADLFVDGASSLAKRFGVSDIIIGLTIVAIGTTTPELFVNIHSAIDGNTDIAIGNVVGSNITNILMILGITAIIKPFDVLKRITYRELPFSFLTIILLIVLGTDSFLGIGDPTITRSDGIVLLLFFVIFLYYTLSISRTKRETEEEILSHKKIYIPILMTIGGLVLLIFGGKYVVEGGVKIANFFGVSQSLIGLSIIAIGTSLPELATAITAGLKNKIDIAMGDIIGASIINILWVLGVTSIINPIKFPVNLDFDLLVNILALALLFLSLQTGKKHKLERWQGAIMLIVYIIYLVFIFLRE